ncbi:class F sortase [Nonomuraea sp. NPDC050556]|uniref:class F sortase n=1 Tax=Nonomuraea sp. NPDC050556 TaxID=3364369 RepID=UPI00379B5805
MLSTSRRSARPTGVARLLMAGAAFLLPGTVVTEAGPVRAAALAADGRPEPGGGRGRGGPEARTDPARNPVPVWRGRKVGRLTIESIGVHARIDQVAIVRGVLQVPPIARVGWWRGGARITSPAGGIVLDGHVSDSAGTPGALHRLMSVKVGAKIALRMGDHVRHYRTVSIRKYRKHDLPRRIFSPGGDNTLYIISCTTRVGSPGSYRHLDNAVLHARPIDRTATPP